MKKIIILSFVTAMVIFLGMNLSSSARLANIPNGDAPSLIHYEVKIHPDWKILHSSCPLMVAITDGQRNVTGQPQLYHYGTNTYHFYEMGPFSGTRIAELINGEVDQHTNVCYEISLMNLKAGTFNNGQTYMFDLFGSAKDIFTLDNSAVKE
jgi:hypothetical protein